MQSVIQNPHSWVLRHFAPALPPAYRRICEEENQMPRPKPQPKRGRTGVVNVRLWTEEKEGLAQLAETLGETPSRVLRRLIREAINGGPDYFEDGAGEIRRMRYELTRIGRNLNQFARAVNRGERVMSADLRRAFKRLHCANGGGQVGISPRRRSGGGAGLAAVVSGRWVGLAFRRADGTPGRSCPEPQAERRARPSAGPRKL